MIVGKFWSAFRAQLNKIANMFWEADPIAQMQYEHDRAVEQMKEGRTGLETYRALVERVNRQVAAGRTHVQKLEAQTKAYLKAGERETAAKFALEMQKAKKDHPDWTAWGNDSVRSVLRRKAVDVTDVDLFGADLAPALGRQFGGNDD